MDIQADLDVAIRELETSLNLAKCRQCGCLSETLEQIGKSLEALPPDRTAYFREALPGWVGKMKPIRYACLGCEHCYAGAAQNAFTAAFPETENQFGLSCEIQANPQGWPPVVGEYLVLDPAAPVAVTTLASANFPQQLADLQIPGLAIVGKLETENIGIDKIIKNTLANPGLRYLILAGSEPKGHLCGQTLLALAENGVDENRRVIGAQGKRPILQNVTRAEIDAFRKQIQIIDLIGCECTDCVRDKVAELRGPYIELALPVISCGCTDGSCQAPALPASAEVPTVRAAEADAPVKLDPAGYLVIYPIQDQKVIHVEHYSYDNRLLHRIEGTSVRTLYLKIIEQGWVSELSHAAYLGKELAKAEASLAFGTPYTQDAA